MTADRRPRLARRARLRFDRHAGQWLLLYPERGLVLNESAAAVVALLTGEHAVEAIVTRLSARYPSADRRDLERDVVALLGRLRKRRLLDTV
jgi:pyrroloquinoline quinone biosynthesis protein D